MQAGNLKAAAKASEKEAIRLVVHITRRLFTFVPLNVGQLVHVVDKMICGSSAFA